MSDPTPLPPVPAPKSGPSALKIILIILGSLVLLFVLVVFGGIYACSHFLHKAIEKHGDKTTLSIPGTGSITTKTGKNYSAEDLGVDIYPGAKPEEDSSSSMDLPTGTVTTASFSTSDPVSKVQAFYKDKLGSASSTFSMGETAMFSKKISDKETVTITIASKGSDEGKTAIVIIHTKKK